MSDLTMCEVVVGALAGAALMAFVLMGWHAVRAMVEGKYGQAAGVVALVWAVVGVAAYPVVAGLVLLLALCVGGFFLLLAAGNDAGRHGHFFSMWCCFDAAGNMLKVCGVVLVALFQAVADAGNK